MPIAIGENVGPYRILEQLGQGGMATVFKAYHAALDRYVAIKVLHPAFMEDPGFLARFRREAKVVARLEHPAIVPIYDFSEHAGQPYLVMKFIEGETLKARLARGPLAIQEGLQIVEAVGAALTYAHKRGILHRDIKPSNVLLTPEGSIYLADFGLARIAEAGESTLSGDMLIGTPHYISPEQARGEKKLDEGTDIYSLGVVVYELTVGRVPFSADTPFSIIHDHIYTPLPLPRKVNPSVPEPVERILLKALAKDRGDRYATVEDLVTAFREASSGSLPRVKEPPPAARERLEVSHPEAASSSRPAGAASGEATRVEAPALGQAGPKTAPRPAQRKALPWVIGGLAISCLCLLGFLVAGSRASKNQATLQSPVLGQTSAAPTAEKVERPVSNMQKAMEHVASNPQDPEAHLKLGDVMRESKIIDGAIAEYTLAGQLFLRKGMHIEAAEAFAEAMRLAGGPEKASAETVDGLTQSMFLAADSERINPLLDDIGKTYPEWAVVPTIRARGLALGKRFEMADRLINELLTSHPEDALIRAVNAEYLYLSGEPREEALSLVDAILDEDKLSPWLENHLRELRTKIAAG